MIPCSGFTENYQRNTAFLQRFSHVWIPQNGTATAAQKSPSCMQDGLSVT
ncbi:hypothetical protein IWX88_001387 [Frigoribacterium sp. CG_9.8]|nr:hypothetical protein [Frigoribacterium sp. CG_9.8]